MSELTEKIASKESVQNKTKVPNPIPFKKANLFARYAAVAVGSAGSAIALMGFANPKAPEPEHASGAAAVDAYPKPETNVEMVMATKVANEMSFGDAFATARKECGPNGFFTWHGKPYNTLYEEEFTKLSPEEKLNYINNYTKIAEEKQPAISATSHTNQHHPIQTEHAVVPPRKPQQEEVHTALVIHEVAPIAEHVSDDMSFADAFAIARNEVGPGGLFQYQGHYYNTYSKEEMAAMTPSLRNDFAQSVKEAGIENVVVENTNISQDDINIVVVQQDEVPIKDHVEHLIKEDTITDKDGNTFHVAVFEKDGEQYVKVDVDNDGVYDGILRYDENNQPILTDMTGHVVDLQQPEQDNTSQPEFTPSTPTIEDNIDVDMNEAPVENPLDSNDPISSADFDDSVNMNDWSTNG
jgi:hypothetical protein